MRKIQDSERQWAEWPILRGMGLILLAVGFFLLVNGLYVTAQKYGRISQWAPVDAEVLDFKVVNEASGRVSNGNRAHFSYVRSVILTDERSLHFQLRQDNTGSSSGWNMMRRFWDKSFFSLAVGIAVDHTVCEALVRPVDQTGKRSMRFQPMSRVEI